MSVIEIKPYKKRECQIAFNIIEAINCVIKDFGQLDKILKQSSKKEAIELCSTIRKNIEVLNRDSTTQWFENNKWMPIEKQTFDADTQTDSWYKTKNILNSLDGIDTLEKWQKEQDKFGTKIYSLIRK